MLSQARIPFARLQATKLHAVGEQGLHGAGYFSSRHSGVGDVEIALFVRRTVLFLFLLIPEMVHEEGLARQLRINSSSAR